jgi:hypothetical protein
MAQLFVRGALVISDSETSLSLLPVPTIPLLPLLLCQTDGLGLVSESFGMGVWKLIKEAEERFYVQTINQ